MNRLASIGKVVTSLPNTTERTAAPPAERCGETEFSGTNCKTASALSILCGVILGLSAPGHDQWYLAWCAIAPLFFLIYSATSHKTAALQSLMFGFAYNFTYLHWLFNIHPSQNCPMFMKIGLVLIVCLHQSLIFAVFSRLCRSRLLSTVPLLIPLSWVLLFNKIGNAPLLFGVPWTMVEYSQYKQSYLLPLLSTTGGIGLGAAIVLTNLCLYFACNRRLHLVSKNRGQCYGALLLLPLAALSYLFLKPAAPSPLSNCNLVLLQGNAVINRSGTNIKQVMDNYMALVSKAAPGSICLWPEWSMPMHFSQMPLGRISVAGLARSYQQDWIVGGLDADKLGREYNAVYAFSKNGKMLDDVYRKRMLVLFGEYMPWVISRLPFGTTKTDGTPQGESLVNGCEPTIFKLADGKLGALICLEVVSPELVTETVRQGAQLLVDCSNTTWFDTPMVGSQMLAFCVFRAAETGRELAFCTTTGPSTIVDRNGRIKLLTKLNTRIAPGERVNFYNDLTPFSKWYR